MNQDNVPEKISIFHTWNNDLGIYETRNAVTGELITQEKIEPKIIKWVYSDQIADIIIHKIATGGRISEICGTDGIPGYPTVAKWRKTYPKFDELVLQAFKDRGEYHRDQALKIAEESTGNVDGLTKLRVDTHLKAAQFDNQERFGAKQKVDVDHRVTHFVIDTGIRRPEDPGYFKDQTRIAHNIEEIKDVTELGKNSALPAKEHEQAYNGGDNNGGKDNG